MSRKWVYGGFIIGDDKYNGKRRSYWIYRNLQLGRYRDEFQVRDEWGAAREERGENKKGKSESREDERENKGLNKRSKKIKRKDKEEGEKGRLHKILIVYLCNEIKKLIKARFDQLDFWKAPVGVKSTLHLSSIFKKLVS